MRSSQLPADYPEAPPRRETIRWLSILPSGSARTRTRVPEGRLIGSSSSMCVPLNGSDVRYQPHDVSGYPNRACSAGVEIRTIPLKTYSAIPYSDGIPRSLNNDDKWHFHSNRLGEESLQHLYHEFRLYVTWS